MEHIGQVLPVTCSKDFEMLELWDDRCVQVVPNTGETIEERQRRKSSVLQDFSASMTGNDNRSYQERRYKPKED